MDFFKILVLVSPGPYEGTFSNSPLYPMKKLNTTIIWKTRHHMLSSFIWSLSATLSSRWSKPLDFLFWISSKFWFLFPLDHMKGLFQIHHGTLWETKRAIVERNGVNYGTRGYQYIVHLWCTFDRVTFKVILGSFGAFPIFRNRA